MKRIKQTLQKLIDQRASEWLDVQTVRLGKDSTQLIETGKPGVLWARLSNGRSIKVYIGSANVPSRFDLRLKVGRKRSQPAIWQVISTLEDYDAPAGAGEVSYHHKQHEEEGGDRLNLSWKQIVARSVRVKNAAGFIVRVFGDPDLTINGYVLIPTQDRDLSSYVPATGALFVAIESDDDGVLSENAGTGFAAPGVGTTDDYPVPAAGKYTRAFVLLFEGQTALLDKHIIIPKPPSFNPTAFAGATHNHDSRYPRKWTGKTTAPTVNDDSGDGYAVDDIWVDETNDEAYIAVDVTVGAAVWLALGSGSFDLAAAIHAAGSATPTSDDEFPFWEDTSGEVRTITYAAYLSLLSTYFSGIFAADPHEHDIYPEITVDSVDPTVDDDTTLGFTYGDIWVNSSSQKIFQNVDPSDGVAVWLEIVDASTLSDILDALNVVFAPISKGVTNGDTHDHNGGDGAQIDHGGVAGLADDDHTQYVRHNLSTAVNDFLMGSGSNTWIKQTLAQAVTAIRTVIDTVYAPIAKGVTNGDSHNHVGGDGGALNYSDVIGAFLGGVQVPAATTWYSCPFKVTVDINQNSVPWPEGGVLSLLSIRVSTTQPATGSLVATLQVNGSDTALVVTITNALGSPVTVTDSTHTVNLSAGDTLRWKFVNNAPATASATLQAATMLNTKTTT